MSTRIETSTRGGGIGVAGKSRGMAIISGGAGGAAGKSRGAIVGCGCSEEAGGGAMVTAMSAKGSASTPSFWGDGTIMMGWVMVWMAAAWFGAATASIDDDGCGGGCCCGCCCCCSTLAGGCAAAAGASNDIRAVKSSMPPSAFLNSSSGGGTGSGAGSFFLVMLAPTWRMRVCTRCASSPVKSLRIISACSSSMGSIEPGSGGTTATFNLSTHS